MREGSITPTVLGALVVAVSIVGFRRAISAIYVLNFDVGGPNATVILAGLLLTGWTVTFVPAICRRPRLVTATFVVFPVAIAISLASDPLVATLGATATLTVGTPLLVGLVQTLGWRSSIAAALGGTFHLCATAVLGAVPVSATLSGRIGLIAAAGLVPAVWILTDSRGVSSDDVSDGLSIPVLPAIGYLWLLGIGFGSPAGLAVWSGGSYPIAAVATLGGLLAGSAVAAWEGPSWKVRAESAWTDSNLKTTGRWTDSNLKTTGAWTVTFLASAVAVAFGGPIAVGGLFPAHLTAVVLLARASVAGSPRSSRRVAAAVTLLQALGTVLVFLHVVALNWTYFPDPIAGLLAGRLVPSLVGVWLVFPVAVAVSIARTRLSPADDRSTDTAAPKTVNGNDDWDGSSSVDPELDSSVADPDGGSTTVDPDGRSSSVDSDGPASLKDPDRRAILGVAGTGLVGLAGLGVRERLGDARTPASGDGSDDREQITVGTYNVHQFLAPGGDYSHQGIRAVIGDANPDVVGLQETDTGRITSGAHDGVRWLATELGYHYARGPPTREATYGVALLSRWPIVDWRFVLLPVGNSQPYPALVAEVDAPDGRLPVIVAHFQVQVEGHRQPAQARTVVDRAAEYDRAIVLGDFNVTPDGQAYRVLDEAFRDAWTVAAATPTTGETYSTTDPNRRIDHVWITDDWTVREAWTAGTTGPSDHRAVLARLDPE